MEFGKVTDVSGINFDLPEDDPRTALALGGDARKSATQFEAFMGAPAWGSKAWIGQIYPRGTKPSEFLELYSRRFNCVELNATHYRVPDRQTLRKWRDSTAAGFRFCPKVPQEISHRRTLVGAARETSEFFGAIAELGPKLGHCFFQLPPHFAPMDLPKLRSWLALAPRDFRIAIEFRHPGFFAHGRLDDSAYRFLQDAGASSVITDVAGRRDVLHASLTDDSCFLRLILNGLHPSDFVRAKAWAERLRGWKESGLRTAYLIVHQPDDVAAPEFAQIWKDELNSELETRLAGPLDEPLARDRGQLGFFD